MKKTTGPACSAALDHHVALADAIGAAGFGLRKA